MSKFKKREYKDSLSLYNEIRKPIPPSTKVLTNRSEKRKKRKFSMNDWRKDGKEES